MGYSIDFDYSIASRIPPGHFEVWGLRADVRVLGAGCRGMGFFWFAFFEPLFIDFLIIFGVFWVIFGSFSVIFGARWPILMHFGLSWLVPGHPSAPRPLFG